MTRTITFDHFAPEHLEGALALSQAAGWPHRRADWELVLGLGSGVVALHDDKVVATAVATPFGDVAMANMIIVDQAMRGRGLGRTVMERMMALATPQEWRLVATEDGLPLYRKLGFAETGRVLQMQGTLKAVAAPQGPVWATASDLPAIAALDRAATGADRATLLARLAVHGRLAVLPGPQGISGFACLRSFGRGEVAGPVVACREDDAKALMEFIFSIREGAFMRVDAPLSAGLERWLAGLGLAEAGGGILMQRGGGQARPSAFRTFALAAQALG